MNRYYLWLSDAKTGPYSIGQLRSMWANGSVNMDTLYTTDTDGNWYHLSGLERELSPQAPQPVAAPSQHYVHSHVKATTELTSKSIKGWMAMFVLGCMVCTVGLIFSFDSSLQPLWGGGLVICICGFVACRIAKWWEHD